MQIAKRLTEIKNKANETERNKYLGFYTKPVAPASLNAQIRNQFYFDVMKRNDMISRKINGVSSYLPDREGVREMVKKHDERAALASNYKGNLPTIDPLVQRRLSVQSGLRKVESKRSFGSLSNKRRVSQPGMSARLSADETVDASDGAITREVLKLPMLTADRAEANQESRTDLLAVMEQQMVTADSARMQANLDLDT